MIGRATLNRSEYQLMCAAVGAMAIPGMEPLMLREDNPPAPSARDGLVEKGLLEADESGGLRVNNTAGYLFSRMAGCTARLQMDVAFASGRGSRRNLYLIDDAFVFMEWDRLDGITYTWLSTIPQGMGAVLERMRNTPVEAGRADIPVAELFSEDPTVAGTFGAAFEAGLNPVAAVRIATEGTEPGFAGEEALFVVDAEGAYFADLRINGAGFEPREAHELLGPASEKVLAVHRERIMRRQAGK